MAVAERVEAVQRRIEPGDRLVERALLTVRVAEIDEGPCLPVTVAERLEQGQRLLQLADGPGELSQLRVTSPRLRRAFAVA
jgi:hypothetical protein